MWLDKMRAELKFIKNPTLAGDRVEADTYEVSIMEEKIRWEEFQQRRRVSGIKTIIHN